MNKQILEIISSNKGYSINDIERKVKSNLNFGKIIKEINLMIDEGLVFEMADKYFIIDNKKYFKGLLIYNKRHGLHVFINERIYYVYSKNDFKLYPKDEIVFFKKKHNIAVEVKTIKRNLYHVYGLVHKQNKKVEIELLENIGHNPKYVLQGFKMDDNDLVILTFLDYQKTILKVEKVLGTSEKAEHIIDMIFSKNGAIKGFNTKVLQEIKQLEMIKEEQISDHPDYQDFTNLTFVTIDGDDSKDFDDAICVIKNKNTYRLYVAIADVSHYVKQGSELDICAYQKGTSIYYPNGVEPMLPKVLSNGICSLNEGVNRLTLTVYLEYDLNGKLLNTQVFKAIINSKKRLTYHQVNDYTNFEISFDENINVMLDHAIELSNLISNINENKDLIEFESDEFKFELDAKGNVVAVKKRESGFSEKLIENFMIEVNKEVASIMKEHKIPCLYRNHDSFQEEKLEKYYDTIVDLGYDFKDEEINRSSIKKSLLYFENSQNFPTLSKLLLRSMAKAKYQEISTGHFGLNLDNYLHFTSPIRRYPDLYVHRMLKKALFDQKLSYKDYQKTADIAENCSKAEEIAGKVENAIVDLRMCQYLKDQIGEIFDGSISSITEFGIYVTILNGIEGMVYLKTLGKGFIEANNMIYFKDQIMYNLCDKVRVKLVAIDYIKQNIDFEIV